MKEVIIAQAEAVMPERKRCVGAGCSDKFPRNLRMQNRQSRIIAALNETLGEMKFVPAGSLHPDIEAILSRSNIEDVGLGQGVNVSCTLSTAEHRKTTINLSGLDPLSPTHRVDAEGRLTEINPGLSEGKLAMLTSGGWGSKELWREYQRLEKQRLEAEKQAELLLAQAELAPEIPW